MRGYENDDGSFTIVADEELDALAPRKSRDIDLRRFVQREEIPRQLLERPYVLAPAGESTKAYHLLAADDGARRQAPASRRSSCAAKSTWRRSSPKAARCAP